MWSLSAKWSPQCLRAPIDWCVWGRLHLLATRSCGPGHRCSNFPRSRFSIHTQIWFQVRKVWIRGLRFHNCKLNIALTPNALISSLSRAAYLARSITSGSCSCFFLRPGLVGNAGNSSYSGSSSSSDRPSSARSAFLRALSYASAIFLSSISIMCYIYMKTVSSGTVFYMHIWCC